jgi:hypothetical protein
MYLRVGGRHRGAVKGVAASWEELAAGVKWQSKDLHQRDNVARSWSCVLGVVAIMGAKGRVDARSSRRMRLFQTASTEPPGCATIDPT